MEPEHRSREVSRDRGPGGQRRESLCPPGTRLVVLGLEQVAVCVFNVGYLYIYVFLSIDFLFITSLLTFPETVGCCMEGQNIATADVLPAIRCAGGGRGKNG